MDTGLTRNQCHIVEIAKATVNMINRKKFCSGQKVLRPDSYIPRVFDRVGATFMEKIKIFVTISATK